MPKSWPSGKANPNLSVSQAWYKHRTTQKITTTTTNPYDAAPKQMDWEISGSVGLLALKEAAPRVSSWGVGGPIPSLPWGMGDNLREVGVGGKMQQKIRPWFISVPTSAQSLPGKRRLDSVRSAPRETDHREETGRLPRQQWVASSLGTGRCAPHRESPKPCPASPVKGKEK